MRIGEDMAPVLTRWALPLPLRFEGSLLPRRTLSSAPLHSPRLWAWLPTPSRPSFEPETATWPGERVGA